MAKFLPLISLLLAVVGVTGYHHQTDGTTLQSTYALQQPISSNHVISHVTTVNRDPALVTDDSFEDIVHGSNYYVYYDEETQNECLRAINRKRNRHESTPPLIVGWNTTKYTVGRAKRIVTEIENKRQISRGEHPYGESFFWYYDPNKHRTIDEAVQTWYAEGKNYDYNTPGFSQKTGGFTQMIWKGSREVTCVKVDYLTQNHYKTLLVANFWPPGNVRNKFAFNVLPPRELSHEPSYPSDDDYQPRPKPTTTTTTTRRPPTHRPRPTHEPDYERPPYHPDDDEPSYERPPYHPSKQPDYERPPYHPVKPDYERPPYQPVKPDYERPPYFPPAAGAKPDFPRPPYKPAYQPTRLLPSTGTGVGSTIGTSPGLLPLLQQDRPRYHPADNQQTYPLYPISRYLGHYTYYQPTFYHHQQPQLPQYQPDQSSDTIVVIPQ